MTQEEFKSIKEIEKERLRERLTPKTRIDEINEEIGLLFSRKVKEGKIPIMKSKSERKDIWDDIFIKGYKKCFVNSCKNDATFTILNDKDKPMKSYCDEHRNMVKLFKRNKPLDEVQYKILKARLQEHIFAVEQNTLAIIKMIDEFEPTKSNMMYDEVLLEIKKRLLGK